MRPLRGRPEKTCPQFDITKFRDRDRLYMTDEHQVQPVAASHNFRSERAKSLWSRCVQELGEILPTFQRALFEMAFPGSNPGTPANHCRLCGLFPPSE